MGRTVTGTWPTVAPTADPSFPGAGTAAPSVIKEFFLPPSAGIEKKWEETSTNTSGFFQGIYETVADYDYLEFFNETIRGFQYPTQAPTSFPTENAKLPTPPYLLTEEESRMLSASIDER